MYSNEKTIIHHVMDSNAIDQLVERITENVAKQIAKNLEPKADPILSLKDTAKYLGVSTPTVHRWIKEGVLPTPKLLGRQPKFYKSQLDNILKDKVKPF